MKDHDISIGDVSALKFHPEEQMLISASMSGKIGFSLFDDQTIEKNEAKFQPRKAPIRCLEYLLGKIVSADNEGYICLSSFDPKVISKWKLDEGISSVCAATNNVLICGDDEGNIFGIDTRVKKGHVFSIQEQTDFISSIVVGRSDNPLKTILATSGDCTLGVYDLRKSDASSLVAMSDEQEDELNCALIMNNEQHALTGTANGVVGIWKQGYWGDVKDRLPLYSKGIDGACSIEYLKKVDEKRFIATTSDGIVRLVSLYPNTIDSVIGVHRTPDNKEVGTVSAMDCDPDCGLVATTSGDGIIKFWDIPKENEPKRAKPQHQNPEKANRQSFFGDI